MELITKESLESEYKSVESCIKDYKEEIQEIREHIKESYQELDKIKEKMEQLKKHESRSLEGKTLRREIYKFTKTIPIMDEFERLNKNGFRIYERLIPKTSFSYVMWYNFIIERRCGRDCIEGITMTDFKNGLLYNLTNHVRNEIPNIDQIKFKHKEQILFSTPFALNAQNSTNREGYGTEWDWSYGVGSIVKEGTKYGETTSYCIVGIETC